ncbi:alpha/beta hydrolase [Brevibacterium sediminis]|uniref:alpha/beta fold hydrolase n=1 Tax=Brevibacterium sediminis TaxID=1857024 RepID=UPI00217558DD|nr:alpha/beta hydrolase [Brevibacterium sediminis]MCS4593310.1 alpha/beta hydrolase [Brevibacterium sediminis]
MKTPTDRSPALRISTDRITLSDGAEVATTTLEPTSHDNVQDRLGEVIICHGTPWSARMWLPLARELAQTNRVRLWDMPGYGDSIPATSGDSIPDPSETSAQPTDHSPAEASPAVDLITQRRRLAELIDCWNVSNPHVIAHDIGGAVALGAHLLEGCDFASLYLLDVVTLDPWGSPFFRLVAENEKVFAALPPRLHRALAREYISGAAAPTTDESPSGDDRSSLSEEWIAALSEPWCTKAGQAAFYRQIAALRPKHTAPIVDRLGEVRCPVRIGWGEDDPWIPADQADRLAEALPGNPHMTRFPRSGHLVPLEAPHDLLVDVTAWLDV